MFIDRGPVPLSAIRRGGAKVRILERTFIPPSEWRRKWDIVVAINILPLRGKTQLKRDFCKRTPEAYRTSLSYYL